MHAKDDDEQPPSLHVSGTGRILAVVLVTNLLIFPVSIHHGWLVSLAIQNQSYHRFAAVKPRGHAGVKPA